MAVTKTSTVSADGLKIFYRHAGSPSAPTILLLHGFPSSSHMFRNLIPLLATKYHVVAPDLPGYGFTVVPAERNYAYTFANFATTIGAFLDALGIERFAVYIFDYGAPTGLRLALRRPEAVAAIISQNGNAYDEGFGKEFWAPIEKLWASGAREDRDALRPALELGVTKWQYTHGNPKDEEVQPEGLDAGPGACGEGGEQGGAA
jgi:pimeloyl-ACP methyl ester carboxylesterase